MGSLAEDFGKQGSIKNGFHGDNKIHPVRKRIRKAVVVLVQVVAQTQRGNVDILQRFIAKEVGAFNGCADKSAAQNITVHHVGGILSDKRLQCFFLVGDPHAVVLQQLQKRVRVGDGAGGVILFLQQHTQLVKNFAHAFVFTVGIHVEKKMTAALDNMVQREIDKADIVRRGRMDQFTAQVIGGRISLEILPIGEVGIVKQRIAARSAASVLLLQGALRKTCQKQRVFLSERL